MMVHITLGIYYNKNDCWVIPKFSCKYIDSSSSIH